MSSCNGVLDIDGEGSGDYDNSDCLVYYHSGLGCGVFGPHLVEEAKKTHHENPGLVVLAAPPQHSFQHLSYLDCYHHPYWKYLHSQAKIFFSHDLHLERYT